LTHGWVARNLKKNLVYTFKWNNLICSWFISIIIQVHWLVEMYMCQISLKISWNLLQYISQLSDNNLFNSIWTFRLQKLLQYLPQLFHNNLFNLIWTFWLQSILKHVMIFPSWKEQQINLKYFTKLQWWSNMKCIDVNHVQMYKGLSNYSVVQDAIHKNIQNTNMISFKYINSHKVSLNTN
jgi:hypothetical protein